MAPPQATANVRDLTTGYGISNNTHPNWWADRGLRGLFWRCCVLLTGTYIQGYDSSLINGVQSMPNFLEDLGYPDASTKGLLVGAISIGYIIGMLPAAYFCDKIGRKKPAAFGCVFIIIGAIVSAVVYTNPWAFFGGRILIGFGAAFPNLCNSSHILEIAHPRQATAFASAFNIMTSLGAVIVTFGLLGCVYWENSNSWNWRLMTLLQGFAAVVQLALMAFIPESPRWLVAQGRVDEAHEILAKYHANGDMQDELVVIELAEIVEAQREIEERGKTKLSTWVKTKGNRKRLGLVIAISIMSQWSGGSLVGNYLSSILTSIGVTETAEKLAITGGLAMISVVFCVPFAAYIKYFSRRWIWLTTTFAMVICFAMITMGSALFVEHKNTAAGKMVIAFIYIFGVAYHLSYSSLYYSYMLPLLPMNLRSQGNCISLVLNYSMSFFNQYANPIALAAIAWKYYFVFFALLVVYIPIIFFFFPETKGLSPEESAVLLDGLDALATLRANAEARANVGEVYLEADKAEAENDEKTPV